MDIEKLIELLKKARADGSWNTLADYAHKAATALSTLQIENQALRNAANGFKAENEKLKRKLSELAHLPFEEPGIGDRTRLMAETSQLQAENEKLRAELDLKDKVVELAQRTEQEAGAEINLLAHCVYYKRGGLCRYGGDDPANVCVFGPCPHEKSAEDVLADLAHVKAERDAAVEQLHGICSACMNYSPYHNKGKCGFCVYEPARDKDAGANDNWQWRGIKEG